MVTPFQYTALLTTITCFQGSVLTKKCQKATQLLEQLRVQVHTKKDKNVDILSLSQEVSETPAINSVLCVSIPSSCIVVSQLGV